MHFQVYRAALLAALAACLAFALPAAADDKDVPAHAERLVRALQQGRFDDAAAMFKPRDGVAPPATAAALRRVAAAIGGFPTMHNVLSLPSGTTRKLEIPSSATLVPRPNRFYQTAYTAVAADGRPVFYVLTLDAGAAPQAVLWFEIHFPTPDAASAKRAERLVEALVETQ